MRDILTERPNTAFKLSAVGVGIQILATPIIVALLQWGLRQWELYGMMTYKDSWWAPYIGLVAAIWIVLAAVSIGLGVWGLLLMNTSKVDKVRKGSILVLISALSAFPTGWGFVIGSLLMSIGGVQGFRWRPRGVEKN